MSTMLVVGHSRGGSTARLIDAVVEGGGADGIEGVTVRSLDCADAATDDVRSADAVVLCTPERFGYMAGAMKDFLERIYYDCLEVTRGLRWALVVKAGNDGSGARTSVERIVTGLQWKVVVPPLVVVGEVDDDAVDAAWELGATVGATIADEGVGSGDGQH